MSMGGYNIFIDIYKQIVHSVPETQYSQVLNSLYHRLSSEREW